MMAHQEPITGTTLRTPRAAAAAGIVFSLLLGLALVLLIISAPSDTATEGTWLTDTSQRATIAFALNLVPFAGIAFLWFIGWCGTGLGSGRTGSSRRCFWAAGCCLSPCCSSGPPSLAG